MSYSHEQIPSQNDSNRELLSDTAIQNGLLRTFALTEQIVTDLKDSGNLRLMHPGLLTEEGDYIKVVETNLVPSYDVNSWIVIACNLAQLSDPEFTPVPSTPPAVSVYRGSGIVLAVGDTPDPVTSVTNPDGSVRMRIPVPKNDALHIPQVDGQVYKYKGEEQTQYLVKVMQDFGVEI